MSNRRQIAGFLVLVLGVASAAALLWPRDGQDCGAPVAPIALTGEFTGADVDRRRQPVQLTPVVVGCGQVTDVQFTPDQPETFAIAHTGGEISLFDGRPTRDWLQVQAPEGQFLQLNALAFHPAFATEGRFFIAYAFGPDGALKVRVEEWRVAPGRLLRDTEPTLVRVLLEADEPWKDHNAGTLVFGPDGRLYVGLGDGGNRPPTNWWNSQDPDSHLGKILAFDVDGGDATPVHWAIGLRNPWRFVFDDAGRIIVADVGGTEWEEVGYLTEGANAGWPEREGFDCARRAGTPVGTPPPTDCETGFADPMWVYPHGPDTGNAIIGGVLGSVPPFAGDYLFGDFISGRLWMLTPPGRVGGRVDDVVALGRFPLTPTTFGRDPAGRIYVAANGTVYRLDATTSAQ